MHERHVLKLIIKKQKHGDETAKMSEKEQND